MTNDLAERRPRRSAGQQLFDTLADEHVGLPNTSRGVIFGSNGLRRHGKFLPSSGATVT